MANEVDYTGHAGMFNASVVTALAQVALMDPTNLAPTVEYVGSVNGKGTDTLEVTVVDGDQAAADTAESADAVNQDYTSTSVNVTVARKSIVRELTDLHLMAGSALNEEKIADDLIISCGLKFTDDLCALFPSLSNTSGATGVNLSMDTIYAAKQQLQTSLVVANESVSCILHPVQLNQLENSMRGELGMEPAYPESQSVLQRGGPGFRFSWRGINFFSSDSVTDDATDYSGAMYAMGCFGYADGLPPMAAAEAGRILGTDPTGAIWIEKFRQSRKATLEYIANWYFGISELQDAKGVEILSAM